MADGFPAYNPGVTPQAGSLLYGGLSNLSNEIAQGIQLYQQHKQYRQQRDAMMDFLASDPTYAKMLPQGALDRYNQASEGEKNRMALQAQFTWQDQLQRTALHNQALLNAARAIYYTGRGAAAGGATNFVPTSKVMTDRNGQPVLDAFGQPVMMVQTRPGVWTQARMGGGGNLGLMNLFGYPSGGNQPLQPGQTPPLLQRPGGGGPTAAPAPTGPPGSSSANPMPVDTPDDVDDLESGTFYMGPDGVVRQRGED